MLAILFLCSSLVIASAQYDYSPAQNEGINSGAAQLSQPIPVQNEFNKEFYSYSAPEQEFEDINANDHIANGLKRNVRVIFIKGPENAGLENAAIQLAKAASDDRTAIYVLSKQADASDLANQLQASRNSVQNKPEVHFVKYRTQSDADNAQRTIQSQYDSLPGPTSNHNTGAVPVLDFVSKSALGSTSASGHSIPSSTYLPPNRSY